MMDSELTRLKQKITVDLGQIEVLELRVITHGDPSLVAEVRELKRSWRENLAALIDLEFDNVVTEALRQWLGGMGNDGTRLV